MKKSERLFIVIMLIGLSYLVVYGLWKDKQIEKNAVYVLAKVYKIHNTENGLLYYFRYYFDSNEYKSSLKGFIEMKDSTIVLKLSESRPNLWEQIDGKVPKCLLYADNMFRQWKTFPQCE